MTHFQRDLFLGFDDLFNSLNQPQQKQQSYPPYNVVKLNDNNYVIEIAVAGFDETDITIELLKGQLTVSGTAEADVADINYVHKGISGRDFTRVFTLAETIEVEDAVINKGVLQIGLTNRVPEVDKPRQIKIIKNEPQFLTEGDLELEARLADSAI
jgi:molecular chaperone IbpA